MGTLTLSALRLREPLWRPLLGAMSKTGGAALVSGLLSALAAKLIAGAGGPVTIALFSTLQQSRQAGIVAATANGQTAVARSASALSGVERKEFLLTAACIFTAATALTILLLLIAPHSALAWLGLDRHAYQLLPWLTIPVACSSAFVYLSALLIGMGKVGELAMLQVLASLVLAAGAWPAARAAQGGEPEALVWLLGAGVATSAATALVLISRQRGLWRTLFCHAGCWWSQKAATKFAAMSAGLFSSGLAASGVLLVVRGRILTTQGAATTGHFDAAWTLSMNHVTLILSSLQTYYLPALTRARGAEERSSHVSMVLALTAGATALLIAFLAWNKRPVITLLYSRDFLPAAAYLRWTLLGDYLKVSSWVLSIPLLAAARTKAFLVYDLAAYAAFWLGSAVLGYWLPAAASAAIGFVLMYAVHVMLCAIDLCCGQRVTVEPLAVKVWLTGLAIVAGTSAANWNDSF